MNRLEAHLLKSPFRTQWQKVGIRHHHGIDVPLSALRSKRSCGIGEFNDLMLLIDWCVHCGFNVIQLLPLNDSGDDPSPYSALSSCALNPLFLSLRDLPDSHHLHPILEEMTELNTLPRTAYHDVQSRKLAFLRLYYEEKGEKLTSHPDFQRFLKEEPWLEPYALFKTLKDKLSKNHWMTWPKEWQEPGVRKELLQHYSQDVLFYCLLQYFCKEQLTSVKAYAQSKGILLKGDIPILISQDSCDVWHHPEEFDLTFAAGAPPDYYNKEGQVWGFPLFKWEVMKANNYRFWKQRLQFATRFYDLIRIDHILGFFRIWAVPFGSPSKEGCYLPLDEELWLPQGRAHLQMLAATCPLLPIAEDLGVVLEGLRPILAEMGICGTKVMRWERDWDDEGTYLDPAAYDPVSMTTVSTHDSATLSLWWRDFPDEATAYADQKKWDYSPTLTSSQRFTILKDSHQSGSLFHINLIGEYLALFPELVWEDPEDERINVPGTILPHNWTYRLRPTLEQLAEHQALITSIKNLIK